VIFSRFKPFVYLFRQPRHSVGLLSFILLMALFNSTAQAVTARQFVDLQQGDSAFKGYRRAHAKGICIQGAFHSNGNLAEYTFARVFSKGTSEFNGRFSIAGNNPYAPDLKAPVRSLALNFAMSSTQVWRIAMNTPPVMAVTNPTDFYQQLQAIKQGPQAIKSFFKQHPESQDFLNWKSGYTATNSFAEETYHSINAFYLIDQQGQRQAVRWYFKPVSGDTKHQAFEGDNALQQELISRLSAAPVRFDWVFILAQPKDDENNPAKRWPAERKHIVAGQVEINQWQEQLKGACHSINFDPLVLPPGIEPTQDPILRARSAAYAESYHRRAKEALKGAFEEADNE